MPTTTPTVNPDPEEMERLDAVYREHVGRTDVRRRWDRGVLEVGCGMGGRLATRLCRGAPADNALDVDLHDFRLQEARKRHPELTVAPGGRVLWYAVRVSRLDNRNTRGVGIRDIPTLFPAYAVTARRITLLSPLVRRLGRLTSVLYRPLAAIRPLRTHYLAPLTKT